MLMKALTVGQPLARERGGFLHLLPVSAPPLTGKCQLENRLLAGPVWLSITNIYVTQ